MQLNHSTDIALRTLIYLARKQDSATIQEIADTFAIAKTHLMKVVMALVAANLLSSQRGRNGGIRLGMPAEKIFIGAVVQLMENSLALVACMRTNDPQDCPLLPDCRLKNALHEAQSAFFSSLNQRSLADLV